MCGWTFFNHNIQRFIGQVPNSGSSDAFFAYKLYYSNIVTVYIICLLLNGAAVIDMKTTRRRSNVILCDIKLSSDFHSRTYNIVDLKRNHRRIMFAPVRLFITDKYNNNNNVQDRYQTRTSSLDLNRRLSRRHLQMAITPKRSPTHHRYDIREDFIKILRSINTNIGA